MNGITKHLRLAAAACSLALAPGFALHPPVQVEEGETQVHITQVDESQFPQITVYVSVTDAAGEPVAVEPGRLTLAENGATVAAGQATGQGESGPLTTLLVVDVSGSMNEGGKLAAAQEAARAYVSQMRPSDQAGLLAFNTELDYVQPLTTDQRALLQAIDGLKAARDTAMYDALAQAEEILAGASGRKAIIALTDGLDNRSARTAAEVAEQIGPGGLSISVVGLGDASQLGVTNAGLDASTLQSLAEQAGGDYGYVEDAEALRQLYERLGRALQSEYAITYTTPETLRDGVNRNLSVSLADSAAAGQAEYNPGGVVPEVAQPAPWELFAAILGGLLVLLIAPGLARRLVGAAEQRKRRGRIRLHEQPAPRVRLR